MQFLNIYNLAPLISSILFLFLGLFVFLKNIRSKINFTFFLVCLVTFWWQFSWVILFSTNSESAASYLVKIGYVGIIFIPITFYHFFVSLIGKEKPIYKFFVSVLYLIGVLFVWTLFSTDYFISGFYRYFWGFYPKAGPLHLVYLAFLSVLVIVIFRLTFKSLQEAREVSSYRFYQIKYVLLALVFYVFAASDFIVNYGVEFYPVGFLFILIFIGIFAYAIVRHRLMDIKVVLRQSFVYLFSVTAIIIPAFAILYYLDRFWPQYVIYVSLVILVLSVLVFTPIRNYYYRVANKYFFSSLYDSGQVIAKLSDGLRSTLDADQAYNLISDTLVGSMRSKAVAVLNYDKAGDQYVLQYNNGFGIGTRKLFPSDKDLHASFIAKSKPVVVEEIKSSAYQEHKAMVDLLTSINAAIIVPLNIKDEVLGVIALGQKESGDMYNDEDLKTLEVIASQSAIAIKNAQLYDETKRFSQTLQAEVERQTKELKRANEELQRLDKAKSDFISIASHQLRTPLTVIKGFTSMILEGNYGQLTDVLRDKLEKIFDSAERLIKLVNDLLDLSHMEGGKMEFNFTKVDFDAMVKSVVEELESNAVKKKLKFSWQTPDKEFWVKADEQKLRQVVMNLIDNAIKYTQQGEVQVLLEHKDGQAVMAVRDTGIGLRPGEAEHLFQKFVRGAEASHYHTEGVGVGLYVAKQLIEAHQGRVWVESEGEGLGSTFFIELPEWNG